MVVIARNAASAARPLNRALPNRGLNSVTLLDSSTGAALRYVMRRLENHEGLDLEYLETCIEIIGGRLTDLELFIQKVPIWQ